MGVRFLGREAGSDAISYGQEVSSWQLDRRSRIGVATIGVLVDAALGSAAYAALEHTDLEFVVSHLSVSLAPSVAGGRRLVSAVGRPEQIDVARQMVMSSARMTTGGELLGTAACRALGVSRPRDPATICSAVQDPAAAGDPGTGLASTGQADLRTAWIPRPWMGNGLGTVQGGVVLGCAAIVAEQVAALDPRAAHGQAVDLSLEILRSPVADGSTEYVWTSEVLRRGRRLTVIDTRLADLGGRVLAQSTATVLTSD